MDILVLTGSQINHSPQAGIIASIPLSFLKSHLGDKAQKLVWITTGCEAGVDYHWVCFCCLTNLLNLRTSNTRIQMEACDISAPSQKQEGR